MNGFLKLNSATTTQDGSNSLSISFVNCTVDPANDEDVDYTPTSSATVVVRPGAQVQIVQLDNNLQTVAADWLVDHQVVSTPYFYYRDDAQHQITALQEIYHP